MNTTPKKTTSFFKNHTAIIEITLASILTFSLLSIFYYQGLLVRRAKEGLIRSHEAYSQLQQLYSTLKNTEDVGSTNVTPPPVKEQLLDLGILVSGVPAQRERLDSLRTLLLEKPPRTEAYESLISKMLATENSEFKKQEIVENGFWQWNRILFRGGVLALYFGLLVIVWTLYRKNKRRYELESSLRENDILTRAMMDGGKHGIIVSNKDRIVTVFNKAAERIYGYDAADFLGKNAPNFTKKILLKSELEAEAERLGREAGVTLGIDDVFTFAIQKYGTYEKEWTIIRKDGIHISVSLTCTTLRDDEGKMYGFIAILQDISERKKLESKLFKNDILTRAMMDSGSHGVVITNKERIVIGFNKAAEILSGFGKDHFLGKQAPDFVDKSFLYSELEAEAVRIGQKEGMSLAPKDVFFFAIKKYGTYQRECTLVQKNGTHVPIFLTCMRVLGEDGNISGSISILQDISERKKLERMQKEFISIVSHELRTPLTSIRGALGLMETPGLDSQKMSELISMAHRNSERLVKITNDILDVEKIEFGNLALNLQLLDVDSFIRNALEANQAYGEKNAVRFVQKESSLKGLKVLADADRLMQVMTNLFSNAAKFSPADSEVIVETRSVANRIHFSVRDSGPGIPENFRARIFDKFAQAESTENRSHAGSGLGLNITKRLVEAMGGNIRFETMMGKGTTFHFDLPQG